MNPGYRKFLSVLFTAAVLTSPSFSKKKTPLELFSVKPSEETATEPEETISDSSESEEFTPSDNEITALAPPEKKDRSFFASVDQHILEDVYTGSPDSLLNAVYTLKRIPSPSDPEKVLFIVSYSMMNILWPSIHTVEKLPDYSGSDSYTAAIETAKHGLYDFNTGNADFLTKALPSLVLAVSDSRADYFSEAEASLKECIQEKENSVFVSYLYGLLLKRQKKYEESSLWFKKAAESCSVYEVLWNLAENAFLLKDYENALHDAELLLERKPDDKNLLELCARSAFENGRLEKAETYVNRVLQNEPGNGIFILFRTKILVARGEYIRASSLLDAYSRTDSTSRDYLYLRFRVQKDWNKNITAAASTIEKALELYPEDDEIILAAAALASENRLSISGWSGEELADKILEENPDSYDAMKIKVQAMMAKKNWTDAYKTSSGLLKHKNVESTALHTHIQICLASGHKDEAWKLSSELYSKQPSDENAIQSYIQVLIATSRKNEAARQINQLLPSASTKIKSFLYYEKSFLSSDEGSILSDLRSSLTANPRNRDSLFRLYEIYFNKREYKKAQYYLKQVVAISPKDEDILELNRRLESLVK